MRIGLNALFLLPGGVGGTEMYVRRLVRALAAAAPDDEFLLYVNLEAAGTFGELPSNVRELRCDLAATQRPLRIAYEQLRLPWLARRDGVDVLHSLGYTGPLVAHCPTVVTLHDLNYHFHPEDWAPAALWANRVLIPQVAKRSTRVLTISRSSQEAIRDVLGVESDVVYHGVDGNIAEASANTRRAVRERFDLRGPYILSVTASHPHKNLAGLLEAYALMTDPPPLVIVGIKGRDHARLEAASLRGRIVVTGWVDDAILAALYREAHAFVFASKYEGFGFPVLEAMSLGVPVASSTATSLPELVGDAAVKFNPSRPQEIASAMQRIVEDEALRSALIDRGRERAKQFTWDRCARETLAVYRRVIRNGNEKT